MFELKNECLTALLGEHGELLFLQKNGGENLISKPESDAFLMMVEMGESKETMVVGSRQKMDVTADDNQLTFFAKNVFAYTGVRDDIPLEIALTLTVRLEEDRLIFGTEIANHSGYRVLELEYPRVGRVRWPENKPVALLAPVQCGQRVQNIGTVLGEFTKSRENGSNSMEWAYPGGISMQWLALTDDHDTLFLTGHDSEFHTAEYRACGFPEDVGAIRLAISRGIYVEDGTECTLPENELTLYAGDWHRGVKDYAEWMKPYRPEHCKPEWIRRMSGYFLVINKQQFGYEMWPYGTLPQLYEMAKAHGCDTLGLFGWYHSGHDNQYPDLEVSPTLGGAECLKENIKAVQNAGGHVTLYYQGHLIDETSPFVRNGEGKAVCAKNIWGSPYVEFYNKSHRSSMLKRFSAKMFMLACPSVPLWQKMMVEREDWLAEFGPDGVLYDQIGGCSPYPCFDPTHPHDKGNPAMAFTGGRRKLLRALQTHAKEISPNFAFFSEHITDLYSAYLDAIHGIAVSPERKPGAFRTMQDNPESGITLNYPMLFRYAFPETIITLRNAYPYLEPRFVNYAMVYGFRLEMELRYQSDKDEILADTYREMREYAKKASDLRNRYADTMLLGRYCDRDELESVNEVVRTGCFVQSDAMSVVLFNDNTDPESLQSLVVKDGWVLKTCESPGENYETIPEMIGAGELLVLYYEKERG